MFEDEMERGMLGEVRPKKRIPLARARRLATRICRAVRPLVDFSMVVGSIRRKRPETADIELVVLPKDVDDFVEIMREEGYLGGDRKLWSWIDGVKVELYLAHDPDELGGLILMYTGDWIWNVATRSIAKRRGEKLDQYGFWRSGKLVFQSPYEEDFFDYLGLPYHLPEDRSLAARKKGEEPRRGVKGPRERRRDICDIDEEE